MSEPILSVRDLVVTFGTREGVLTAVNGVSFDLDRGEVLGLVGESGSGKSVTGLAILGLIDAPGRIASGSIMLEGARAARPARGGAAHAARPAHRDDLPGSDEHAQPRSAHRHADDRGDPGARARVAKGRRASARGRRSAAVGIPSPEERLNAYPHQFSGGMRQRVAIAIALLHRPALLIADEPTTALDVTIQAQILAEVQTLAAETGTAMLWITHDLSVVAGLADRIAVMYAGRIVETGSVDDVLERPIHPYTDGLIGSVPSRNKRGVPLAQIPGMTPSLAQPAAGLRRSRRAARAPTSPAAADARAETPCRRRAWRCCHPPLAGERRRMTRAASSSSTASRKRFVKPLDFAGKVANLFGAG